MGYPLCQILLYRSGSGECQAIYTGFAGRYNGLLLFNVLYRSVLRAAGRV